MLLDKSIFIAAPPAAVYPWLAPQRRATWDPNLVRATPLGDGRFDLVGRALGHRFESHAETTAAEADHLFAWRQLEGDYEENRGSFTLEPVRGGTKLHLVADVELPYVMPEVVTEADLREAVSRGTDDALLRLKELVERAAPAV